MTTSKKEMFEEYVDLATTMRWFEGEGKYAEEIGYYTKGLDQDLYNRVFALQQKIVKTHRYFKNKNPKAAWALGDVSLVMLFTEGKVRLTYDGGWGDAVQSRVINNPTGLDMFALADDLVRRSGDSHHFFVEDMEYKKTQNGVRIYELKTGS